MLGGGGPPAMTRNAFKTQTIEHHAARTAMGMSTPWGMQSSVMKDNQEVDEVDRITNLQIMRNNNKATNDELRSIGSKKSQFKQGAVANSANRPPWQQSNTVLDLRKSEFGLASSSRPQLTKKRTAGGSLERLSAAVSHEQQASSIAANGGASSSNTTAAALKQ